MSARVPKGACVLLFLRGGDEAIEVLVCVEVWGARDRVGSEG